MRRVRRRIFAAVGLVALVVGGVGAREVARAWPWLAKPAPERVERGFQVIEEADAASPSLSSDEALFGALARALERAGPALAEYKTAGAGRALPQEALDAIDAAASWAAAPGAAAKRACGEDGLPGRETLDLAFAAIARDERGAVAMIKLSALLRRTRGPSSHALGTTILHAALLDADFRGRPAPEAFREAPLSIEELRGAYAREALCVDSLLGEGTLAVDERGIHPLHEAGYPSFAAREAPWLARVLASSGRERAALRSFAGERLDACRQEYADSFLPCMNDRSGAGAPSLSVRALTFSDRNPDFQRAIELQRKVLAR